MRKTAKPLDDVGEQRVYHLTHISNLASIVATGRVFADATLPERPSVDISSPKNRDARRGVTVDGIVTPPAPAATAATEDGEEAVVVDLSHVDGFVPLSLTPDADFWKSIRGGTTDSRLTKDATAYPASDYVMLVSTVRSIRLDARETGKNVVLTTGDAAAALTRFAATPDQFEHTLRTLRANEDAAPREAAEVLVEGSLSLDLVNLIGVSNDKARTLVKELLDDGGYEARVAVYPPWYAPPIED